MSTIRFSALLLSSILLLFPGSLFACIDGPTSEYARMGSFYQIPYGMNAFIPFIYTYDQYYSSDSDPLRTEKEHIITEWQNETGNQVTKKDIELVLYQSSSQMFLLSYIYHKLQYTFEGNTFITFLTNPNNSAYLEYIVALKQIEYIEFNLYNNWDNGSEGKWWKTGINSDFFIIVCKAYIDKCKIRLLTLNNQFLKTRNYFQLAKLLLKVGRFKECESVVQEFFNLNSKNILNNGMLHYMGVCKSREGDTAQANLYFARSFSQGNERKFRNIQLYYTSTKCVDKSLLLTSNRSEKALLIAMSALRNPGHALYQLKRIEHFDIHIPEFLFLIYREMNKFDDWIASPVYANIAPLVSNASYYKDNFKKILAFNLKNDKAYLNEFINWLSSARNKFNGSAREYLDLAFVHVNLLNEDFEKAVSCFNSITLKPDSPYRGLYKTEQIYLNIINPGFNNDENLNRIAHLMKSFERTAKYDELQCKMLSTLNLILSYKMNNIGRKAYSGLMRLKSFVYSGLYNNVEQNSYNYYYYDYFSNDYNRIEWFDENAGIADIDTLIGLCMNKNKMYYQSFYSDSILCKPDIYRDLKGNIAFRNGDIQLANTTYCQMNRNFWDKDLFKNELRENPFLPKYWPEKRNFNYKFNKAVFTSQLLVLMRQTLSENSEIAAQAWLKLGHAYYNTTWWGNSWMMCEYGRGSCLSCLSDPENEGRLIKKSPYYTCSRAKTCYLNVLKKTHNNELTAVAVFMLNACDMNNAILKYELMDYKTRPHNLIYKSKWLYNFAQKYMKTKVYKEYLSNCSYLTEYMKKGYFKYVNF